MNLRVDNPAQVEGDLLHLVSRWLGLPRVRVDLDHHRSCERGYDAARLGQVRSDLREHSGLYG